MRLQQYLAHAGLGSRRKCESFIAEGRVQVNGEIVRVFGTNVEPGRDFVLFDGKRVVLEEKRVFCFYKPPHVMCSSFDPEGRQTVQEYFKEIPLRLYNVGRLDYDTEGVLLMTNDGELANALTHPSFGVEKCYYAVCRGILTPEETERLRRGVMIGERMTAPAQVKIIRQGENTTQLSITIHEGRNRQIRRMLDSIQHPVTFLRRETFGNLTLAGLRPGQYREIGKNELQVLWRLCGQKQLK